MMYKLILIRHGESTWNQENRFTGWVDVPLSTKGLREAHSAGQLLRQEGYHIDIAFTSYPELLPGGSGSVRGGDSGSGQSSSVASLFTLFFVGKEGAEKDGL